MENKRGSFYLSDHNLQSEPDDKVDYTSHMLIASSKYQSQKAETNFELTQGLKTDLVACYLCSRADGEIVGPFSNKHKKVIYLHKDCIEINTYSYFSTTHKKWLNIETMVKRLIEDA